MEVVDSIENVSFDKETLIAWWKTDYGQLFSESTNPTYDDRHLNNIKRAIEENTIPIVEI